MKLLEKGPGWSLERTCTGSGNGGAGCGAKLLIEAADLFRTRSSHYDGSTDSYITFQCIECKRLTDVPEKDVPTAIQHGMKDRAGWEAAKRSAATPAERRVNTGIALIVKDPEGRVLMGQRKGAHGAGSWSLIGGWMQHGESFLEAARREAKEEADLDIHSIEVVTAMSTLFPEKDMHSITVLVQATGWDGLPKHMELDKSVDGWHWFLPEDAPKDLFKPLAELKHPNFAQVVLSI